MKGKKSVIPPVPKAYWLNITPELAAEWLKTAGHNRQVRDGHVLVLADEMREGRWQPNGETIKLTAAGRVIDGQHRLLACTVSKTPFRTLVVDGILESAYLTIDKPLRRVEEDQVAVARSREHDNPGSVSESLTRYRAAIEKEKDLRRVYALERATALQADLKKQSGKHLQLN